MKKQLSKEDQDIVKEGKRDDFVFRLKSLNELGWKEGYNLIHDFCYSDIKLGLDDIKEILSVENKEFIDLFLREYILFDENDKRYLEIFINENLNNSDTEFVSDLIYFANDISLNLEYLSVLEIITKFGANENYIVLASLNYISNNVKFYYFDKIVVSFEKVINSSDYFHSEQILASLFLYRITHRIEYLDFIAELVELEIGNLDFLTNLLLDECYQEKYFNLNEVKGKIPRII
ncbi:hypothetical protein [Flavobacterium sp. JP2137]|uniref:hypothetical protein n=1 Tax=Flavobacterium sp. JP2137 TaxID=3414510 RepID=UPI003D2FFFD7